MKNKISGYLFIVFCLAAFWCYIMSFIDLYKDRDKVMAWVVYGVFAVSFVSLIKLFIQHIKSMIKESKSKAPPKKKYYVIYDNQFKIFFSGGYTGYNSFSERIEDATHFPKYAAAECVLNKLKGNYFSVHQIHND